MMYGMDISHYQNQIDLAKGNYDFCIIKATEGYNYVDNSFYNYADQLTKLNKLIGCYHYCRPDYHGTSDGMRNEAIHFIDIVEKAGLLNKSILVMDWEIEPFDEIELLLAFLEEIENLTKQTPFIYGSLSKIERYGWDIIKELMRFPIWLAKYPSKRKLRIGKDPELLEPDLLGRDWSIWQYTNLGQYPSYNGNIDLDLSIHGPIWWEKYAGIKVDNDSSYPPTESIPSTEKLSEAMKWAISIGLFVGYENGKYEPNKALSRDEAAMLFQRYTNYLQKIKED